MCKLENTQQKALDTGNKDQRYKSEMIVISYILY